MSVVPIRSGLTAAPGQRMWTLTWDDKPTPMNEYRTFHFRKRADYDRLWRRTFQILANNAKVPRLDRIGVTVAQTCAYPSLPDIGASYPTAKAAIDGLVDAGVIVDDDPEHLIWLAFVPPERGDINRFILVITEGDPTHD